MKKGKDIKKENKQEIEINANTVVGSQYAQLVGVTVTAVDLTLEFVYIHPRDKQGQVVSRVTLPITVGKELSSLINEIIKKHENK